MNITSLHIKILNFYRIADYSIAEIADILSISPSKVRRAIDQLNYILKSKNTSLKCKSFGKKVLNQIVAVQIFTPDERECYLSLILLKRDAINLTSIAKELLVTRRTLANDLIKLKKKLDYFDLKISNQNFSGITLEGKEEKKREYFELYLIKLFKEEKYLPKLFQKFFFDLKKMNKKYNISENIAAIFNTFKKDELLKNTYLILHIEIIMYISIIRKNFTIKDIQSSKNIEKQNLYNVLNQITFLSNYEKEKIISFCIKKQQINFYENYKNEIYEVRDFIDYLNTSLNIKINLNNELLKKIVYVISTMTFKKKFDITEFYIFNNNLNINNNLKFKRILNLIVKYYKNIDSFDKTILAVIIFNELNKHVEKNIKNSNYIVVVYNFLPPGIVKELCGKLNLTNINTISLRELEIYSNFNKLNGIIYFEDIIFEKKYDKIKKLQLILPLSEDSFSKLNFFKKG